MDLLSSVYGRYCLLVLCVISLTACVPTSDSNIPTETANALTIILPVGETYDRKPVYQWEEMPGISQYQIQIDLPAENVFDQVFSAEGVCTGDVCSVKPELTLKTADYLWRVRGFNGEEWLDYSGDKEFSFAGDRAKLNEISYDLQDCISTWWFFPVAKRYVGQRDQTYLGYSDSQGYTGVAIIDNLSGQVIKTRLRKKGVANDHNSVAVDILPDGHILAVYSGGHDKTSQILVRVSENAESIERFKDPIVIEAGKPTTYAQIFQKNNRIWVFFRTGSSLNSSWSYTSSADGYVWEEPLELIFAGMQYYLKVAGTTDNNLLRLVMYSNPNAADSNIRLGFFDTQTREAKLADGTVLGKESINKDQFPVIIPVEEGKRNRLLDVAESDLEQTILAYAVFSDDTDAEYRIGYYTDELVTIPVAPSGAPFFTSSVYVGGAVFGYEPDMLYVSREEDGNWFLEEWFVNDWEQAYKIRTIRQSEPGDVVIRPIIEIEGDRLFWQEGYYNPNSYADFLVNYQYTEIRNID